MQHQFAWWIHVWLGILVLSTIPIILFIRRPEARWTILTMILSVVTMQFMYEQLGLTRLLGVAHLLYWGPLMVYLIPRINLYEVNTVWGAYFRYYVFLWMITLIVDYIDLIRYLAGNDYELLI